MFRAFYAEAWARMFIRKKAGIEEAPPPGLVRVEIISREVQSRQNTGDESVDQDIEQLM